MPSCIIASNYWHSQYHQLHSYRGGVVGSHEVMGRGCVSTENSQMAYIGVIFSSTYHTRQLNPWPNSSASHVVNYSQLYDFLKSWSHLETTKALIDVCQASETSLRNKPQQKQPRQPSAPIHIWIVS